MERSGIEVYALRWGGQKYFRKVRQEAPAGQPVIGKAGRNVGFAFRDYEVLKFLNFAKNKTEMPKLASLRQCAFPF